MSEKSKGELLKEKLFLKSENCFNVLGQDESAKAFLFCDNYKTFLDSAKTEREAVAFVINEAINNGFAQFDSSKIYKTGDKVYYNNRNKALILAVIGVDKLENGFSIVASHIDAPRLDLKPRPVYEEGELAFLKTHYYGGIKKYQWTAVPLAIHGVIIKKDGNTVTVNIGEKENEPVFCVTDLLPHLAKDQMSKTMENGILGEALNVLIGSIPFKDDKSSENVKLNILNLLFEKYGIIEQDFISAELEVVPAFKAKDVGFDKSMIGGYGQDDRVCVFPAYSAIFDVNKPNKTTVVVLTDKEEIGSSGNTGLMASYLKNFLKSLCNSQKQDFIKTLNNSKCLSADVSAGFDPNYPDVNEKNNTAYLNHGTVLTKYTGVKGKASTSDATAELIAYFRKIFDDNAVIWQTGELGKVDQGGGGTVAQYIAHLDIDVVDLGVPVLSMHSPFEITCKSDIYMTYKAILAFFNN